MASMGGHKGGLALTRVLDLVSRHAYKQHHVAWNERGVKAGLPPDVVTLMIGVPGEGFHWNLRRGYMPEYDVRGAARVEDNENILDDLGRLKAAGIGHIPGGGVAGTTSMFHHSKLKKTYKGKLEYIGWRSMLVALLTHRRIRESAELESLLGSKDYRNALHRRARWDSSKAVDLTAD